MKITPIQSFNISMNVQDMHDMVNELEAIPEKHRSRFINDFLTDIKIMIV